MIDQYDCNCNWKPHQLSMKIKFADICMTDSITHGIRLQTRLTLKIYLFKKNWLYQLINLPFLIQYRRLDFPSDQPAKTISHKSEEITCKPVVYYTLLCFFLCLCVSQLHSCRFDSLLTKREKSVIVNTCAVNEQYDFVVHSFIYSFVRIRLYVH